MSIVRERFGRALEQWRASGKYKLLHEVTAGIGPVTELQGRGEVLVFCSNDYLGLAQHPEVVAAGIAGLKRYGAGTASARFICGTLSCHRELEAQLAAFLGTQAALTFTSCWNANEGLLPSLAAEGDAIVADQLNHASLIDAGRLSRATRKVFAHSDLAALEQRLLEVKDAGLRLVVTDGVFSMEGDVARLPELRAACQRHAALLVVDDSHATGVLGRTGRGTFEHFGLSVTDADVITSTLGKVLGGGNGGFVAGPQDLIDTLIQQSRPQLFSNSLAPATTCSATQALAVLRREPERVARLHANASAMRAGLRALGYSVIDSPTGIIPVVVGETALALALSRRLLELGVLVVGFGFPVVPEGQARLRVQMSAAHTPEQIARCLAAFETLGREIPAAKHGSGA